SKILSLTDSTLTVERELEDEVETLSIPLPAVIAVSTDINTPQPEGQFKYHVDFEHLHIGEETGMICVSRPTNPTGNVITDEELM
ncbi:hypothetical protein MJM45_29760, partial [Salmonella enterica subsp. enterica serovar Kentucky]|nr:hypothetical protein [Salmonella enterica subsp. enterica serovar Kentucky]